MSWRPCWRYNTIEYVIRCIVGSSRLGWLTLSGESREIDYQPRTHVNMLRRVHHGQKCEAVTYHTILDVPSTQSFARVTYSRNLDLCLSDVRFPGVSFLNVFINNGGFANISASHLVSNFDLEDKLKYSENIR